jgi:hypothetical protein
MSLETLQPGNHTSPDTTANATNTHTNTGATGGCDGIASNPDQSYRAHTIPSSTKPRIQDKRLKFNWVITLVTGTTGTCRTLIEYSLNGGGSWSTAVDITNSSNTSALDLSMGAAQDLTQVQVRLLCDGSGPTTGTERGMTFSLSNIRVEVTYLGDTGASGGMM